MKDTNPGAPRPAGSTGPQKTQPPKTGPSGVFKTSKSVAAVGASAVRKGGTSKPAAKGALTTGKMAAKPASSANIPTAENIERRSEMRTTGLSLAIKYTIFTALVTLIAILLLVFMAQSSVQQEMDTEINKAGIRLIKSLSIIDIDYWEKKSQDVESKGESANPLVSLDVASTANEKVAAKEPTILNVAITKGREGYYLLSMRGKGKKIGLKNAKPIIITSEDIDITEGLYEESKSGIEIRTRMFKKTIYDKDGLFKGTLYLFLSAKEIDEALNRVIVAFLFPALLTVLFAAALGFFMASQVTKPVKSLVEDMRVVSGGNLEHQSSVKTSDEVGVLAKVFNQMTVSLQSAHQKELETKALERELNIAREIQYNLLPKEIPVVPDYDIGAHYKPCYEVSGDYYDLIQMDSDNIGVVVADVSGKGIPASMIMTMARSLIRMESERNLSPGGILSKVNKILAKDIRRGMFVTAMYYVLNTKTGIVTVASAGHNPLLVWRNNEKRHELVNPNGIALGFDRGPVFDRTIKEQTINLNLYDRIVSYTDGVTESMNGDNEEFGGERFYQLAGQMHNYSSSRFIEGVINTLEEFKGPAPQHDDITIVAIKRII